MSNELCILLVCVTQGILRSVPVLMKFIEASSTCKAAGPQHSRSPAVMYIARLVDSVAAFGPLPADLALQCTMRMVQEGAVHVLIASNINALQPLLCPC